MDVANTQSDIHRSVKQRVGRFFFWGPLFLLLRTLRRGLRLRGQLLELHPSCVPEDDKNFANQGFPNTFVHSHVGEEVDPAETLRKRLHLVFAFARVGQGELPGTPCTLPSSEDAVISIFSYLKDANRLEAQGLLVFCAVVAPLHHSFEESFEELVSHLPRVLHVVVIRVVDEVVLLQSQRGASCRVQTRGWREAAMVK